MRASAGIYNEILTKQIKIDYSSGLSKAWTEYVVVRVKINITVQGGLL